MDRPPLWVNLEAAESRYFNRKLGHFTPSGRPEQTDSRRIYHVPWQDVPPPDQTIVPPQLLDGSSTWLVLSFLAFSSCTFESRPRRLPVRGQCLVGVWGFGASLLCHHGVRDKRLKQSPSQVMLRDTHCRVPTSCTRTHWFPPQVYWDIIFLISGAQGGGAGRRSTLIYHSSFKGTRVHDDRHKIVESAGRGGVTEAIKAHERQMGLYI